MTALTPDEATANWYCPLARTFALKDAITGCRGDLCAVWRWQEISADHPAFLKAIKAELATGITHKAAVAKIMADRAAYGVPAKPERGFCGLGGRP
jgi:hypothetical protein